MANFIVLSQHLSSDTGKKSQKTCQNTHTSGQYFNLGPIQYTATVLTCMVYDKHIQSETGEPPDTPMTKVFLV
jgi:hypothetical protein